MLIIITTNKSECVDEKKTHLDNIYDVNFDFWSRCRIRALVLKLITHRNRTIVIKFPLESTCRACPLRLHDLIKRKNTNRRKYNARTSEEEFKKWKKARARNHTHTNTFKLMAETWSHKNDRNGHVIKVTWSAKKNDKWVVIRTMCVHGSSQDMAWVMWLLFPLCSFSRDYSHLFSVPQAHECVCVCVPYIKYFMCQ